MTLPKGGVWLWGVAQGVEELPVTPRDKPRSLSVERTFDSDTDDFSIIYDASPTGTSLKN